MYIYIYIYIYYIILYYILYKFKWFSEDHMKGNRKMPLINEKS